MNLKPSAGRLVDAARPWPCPSEVGFPRRRAGHPSPVVPAYGPIHISCSIIHRINDPSGSDSELYYKDSDQTWHATAAAGTAYDTRYLALAVAQPLADAGTGQGGWEHLVVKDFGAGGEWAVLPWLNGDGP